VTPRPRRRRASKPAGKRAASGRHRCCRRPRLRTLVILSVAALLLLVGGRLLLLGAAAGTPDAAEPGAVPLGGGTHRAGLVLGAGLRPDGSPTLLLRDRVRAGVKLLERHQVDVLLMSGDNSVQGYNEPSAMRRAAIELGASPEQVAVDYGGRRTWDSCARAKRIFGVDRAIVVSNDFHRARTVTLCRNAGIAVDGAVGTSTARYPPQARAKWQLRELVASWRGVIDAWVREPTVAVGGDPIDPWDPCALKASLAPEDLTEWAGRDCPAR
jgi:SanA protein